LETLCDEEPNDNALNEFPNDTLLGDETPNTGAPKEAPDDSPLGDETPNTGARESGDKDTSLVRNDEPSSVCGCCCCETCTEKLDAGCTVWAVVSNDRVGAR
jgi:hypothetical protein